MMANAANALRLHRAAWVVPVDAPPIEDGAVVVRDGRIVAVGAAAELRARFPEAETRDHGDAALTPALVNAHTHIELAHLAELADTPPEGFIPWVKSLMALRSRRLAEDPEGAAARDASIRECARHWAEGVSVLGDIGNGDLAWNLARDTAGRFPGTLLAFHEYLGLSEKTLPKNLARLESEPKSRLCGGHAPYSTHPALLRAVKERARRLGQIFPIHVAEPESELDFLRAGAGPMADFLLGRAGKKSAVQGVIGPGEGSIHYLDRLGLLDERTLCVHAVHVSEEEIDLLDERGAKVCLCPTSNRFLRVGRAPVRSYLERGILPALGTDSRASNPELSLWREMRVLAEEHPELDSAQIFAMATLGGARALGLEADYGALAPGGKAELLCLPLDAPVQDADGLMRMLVSTPHGVSRICR